MTTERLREQKSMNITLNIKGCYQPADSRASRKRPFVGGKVQNRTGTHPTIAVFRQLQHSWLGLLRETNESLTRYRNGKSLGKRRMR